MPQDPDDRREALAGADEALRRLTAGIRLPVGLYLVLAAGVAVQLGAAAYGIAAQTTAGLAVALGWGGGLHGRGSALAVPVPADQRRQGRWSLQPDRPWDRGLVHAGLHGGFGAATWAAFESRWWLVAVAAVIAGVGYAFGTRRWWRAYRHDPCRPRAWRLAAAARRPRRARVPGVRGAAGRRLMAGLDPLIHAPARLQLRHDAVRGVGGGVHDDSDCP